CRPPRRAEWQAGETQGIAKIFLKDGIAWLVERDFGGYGTFRAPGRGDGRPGKGRIFETEYASSRRMVAWVLHWRQNATVLDPPELASEVAERLELLSERHTGDFEPAASVRTVPPPQRSGRSNGRSESSIRPERFARLVTLAGLLIESAKRGGKTAVSEGADRL